MPRTRTTHRGLHLLAYAWHSLSTHHHINAFRGERDVILFLRNIMYTPSLSTLIASMNETEMSLIQNIHHIHHTRDQVYRRCTYAPTCTGVFLHRHFATVYRHPYTYHVEVAAGLSNSLITLLSRESHFV